MNRLIGMLMVAAMLSGCASLVSNSAWPVFIDNNSGPAEFVIKNSQDVEIARGKTPQIIILPSGAGYFTSADYSVHFSKTGYQSQGYRLASYLNGWYLGNVSNFLGFFIDSATGAMWRLNNEMIVTLPQIPKPALTTRPVLTSPSIPVPLYKPGL